MNERNELATTQPAELARMLAERADVDVDKLEKLMELQLRWDAEAARRAYVAAMAAFKANPPRILKSSHVNYPTKEGRGTPVDYWHAKLSDIVDTVTPALSKHGLSFDWETSQTEKGGMRVTCTVTHVLGHSRSGTMASAPDNSGGKNAIQAYGSASTYLQRYTLLPLLGLAAADDDDGRGGEDNPKVEPPKRKSEKGKSKKAGAQKSAVREPPEPLTVENIEDRTGQKQDGTPWDLALVSLSDGRTYATEDTGLATKARIAKRDAKEILIKWVDSGKGDGSSRDLVSISMIGGDDGGAGDDQSGLF